MTNFEKSILQWLEKNGYKIVKKKEKIEQDGFAQEIAIHALYYNKDYILWSKIAIIIGLLGSIGLWGGAYFPSLAKSLKELGTSLGFAGHGLAGLLFIGGILFYLHSKQQIDQHVWIDFKQGKRKVSKTQMEKLYSSAKALRNINKKQSNEEIWYPKYIMMFSSTGFSEEALKTARQHKIDCISWDKKTDTFKKETWNQDSQSSDDM